MITRAKKTPDAPSEYVDVSDVDIARRYLGISKFPCTCTSLIRDDDKNPSFELVEREGRVYWKDYGTGEYGTIVGLLSRLWNTSFSNTLDIIKSREKRENVPKFDIIKRYRGKMHVGKNSSIKVRVRPWRPWDVEYWKSFGISQKFATWCNVFPISHAFFTKKDDQTGKEFTYCIPMDKYAYAYFEWKDGKESIKLYQPFSTSMKWLSKHDLSVWDLWKHAFKWAEKCNDAVILTSSRKDAMCLWENLKIPAMALQGEGYVPKPQVMKQVLDRFKKVYIWYDNDFKHTDDNPGQDNARKLCEIYPELINVCIPTEYQSKDPSDLVRDHGVKTLKKLWQSICTTGPCTTISRGRNVNDSPNSTKTESLPSERKPPG